MRHCSTFGGKKNDPADHDHRPSRRVAAAPENTLAAFNLAWKQGADAVEIDCHLTADGHLIVCHDGDTQRTTGRKLVIRQSTLAQLRELDAGAWKGARWAGQKLPTLAEVLDTIPENRRLLVEVKVGPEAVPRAIWGQSRI